MEYHLSQFANVVLVHKPAISMWLLIHPPSPPNHSCLNDTSYIPRFFFIVLLWLPSEWLCVCARAMHVPQWECGGEKTTLWRQVSCSTLLWVLRIGLLIHWLILLAQQINFFTVKTLALTSFWPSKESIGSLCAKCVHICTYGSQMMSPFPS